jgi:hypothetical protein
VNSLEPTIRRLRSDRSPSFAPISRTLLYKCLQAYVVAIWSHNDVHFGREMLREIIHGGQWPLLVADCYDHGKIRLGWTPELR